MNRDKQAGGRTDRRTDGQSYIRTDRHAGCPTDMQRSSTGRAKRIDRTLREMPSRDALRRYERNKEPTRGKTQRKERQCEAKGMARQDTAVHTDSRRMYRHANNQNHGRAKEATSHCKIHAHIDRLPKK